MSLLIILSGFWEGVGGFFAAIIMIAIFVIIPLAFFAKLFNVNYVSRSGSKIVDPNTFDEIVSSTKTGVERSYSKIKSLDFKLFYDLKNKNVSKIDRLILLGKLKSDGTITQEEFQKIKDEIMKQI